MPAPIAYKVVAPYQKEHDGVKFVGKSVYYHYFMQNTRYYREGLNEFTTPSFLFRGDCLKEIYGMMTEDSRRRVYRCFYDHEDVIPLRPVSSVLNIIGNLTPEKLQRFWDFDVDPNTILHKEYNMLLAAPREKILLIQKFVLTTDITHDYVDLIHWDQEIERLEKREREG